MRGKLLIPFTLETILRDLLLEINKLVQNVKYGGNTSHGTNCRHWTSFVKLCISTDLFLTTMEPLFAEIESVLQLAQTLVQCKACKKFDAQFTECTPPAHNIVLVFGCTNMLSLTRIASRCNVQIDADLQEEKHSSTTAATSTRCATQLTCYESTILSYFRTYVQSRSYEASKSVLASAIYCGKIKCKIPLDIKLKDLPAQLVIDNGWEDSVLYVMLAHTPTLDAVVHAWPYQSLSTHEHQKKLGVFRSLIESEDTPLFTLNQVLTHIGDHRDYLRIIIQHYNCAHNAFLHMAIKPRTVHTLAVYHELFATNQDCLIFVFMQRKFMNVDIETLQPMMDFLLQLPDNGFTSPRPTFAQVMELFGTKVLEQDEMHQILSPLVVCGYLQQDT